MKTITLAVLLIAIAIAGGAAAAQPFLAPTNPAPQVILAWDPIPNGLYNLYMGVASRGYTNKLAGLSTNQVTVLLPARGVKFYFAVTQTVGPLESLFSSEVTYTATNLPAAPNMQPPVTLVVQYKNDLQDFLWADSSMSWSIAPSSATNQFFRLNIIAGTVVALPQATRLPPLPPSLIIK